MRPRYRCSRSNRSREHRVILFRREPGHPVAAAGGHQEVDIERDGAMLCRPRSQLIELRPISAALPSSGQ